MNIAAGSEPNLDRNVLVHTYKHRHINCSELTTLSMPHLVPFHRSILRLSGSYSTLNAPYEATRIGGRRKEELADIYTNDDLETFRRRRKTDWKRRQGVRLTSIALLLTI